MELTVTRLWEEMAEEARERKLLSLEDLKAAGERNG